MCSKRSFLLVLLVATLSACSAGGSNVAPRVPATTAPVPSATRKGPTGTIAFSYVVPPATSRSSKKRAYVSASTYQASIVVTPQAQAPLAEQIVVCEPSGAGKVCQGQISAPSGIDSIAITLEDQPASGATDGNALSTGTIVAVINTGEVNTVKAVLDGIVQSVDIDFAAPTVGYTLPSLTSTVVSTYFAVNALDADGNTITANGGYVDANDNAVSIALAPSCTACTASLGTSAVSGPGAIVPVQVTIAPNQTAQPALTITPSIALGSTSITVTGATTQFVGTQPAASIYGDGSSGAYSLSGSQNGTIHESASNQFSSFSIAAGSTLTVDPGTVIRVLGNAEIDGAIVVAAGAANQSIAGTLGIGSTAAGGTTGGEGNAYATLGDIFANPIIGGAGVAACAVPETAGGNGGAGGGSLALFVFGSIVGNGSIAASGSTGGSGGACTTGQTNSGSADGGGGGGGGGGAIVIATKQSIAGFSGSLTVAGGDGGASSADGYCPGGAGGGGIVELLAPDATSFSGSNVDRNGGANPAYSSSSATTGNGGGGGPSDGNGSNGCVDSGKGGFANAMAKSGQLVETNTDDPENLIP